MVTGRDGFCTMKGYKRSASDELTSSMEGHLEIVCRMEEEEDPVHTSSLTADLHMRSSFVSKMLDNLKKTGYIDFKEYGSTMITEKGYKKGRCLLHEHQVLQDFFCTLNHMKDELELVEKVGHFINHRMVANMEQALPFLRPESDTTGKMG